jgi:hypothetical protein
VNATGLDLGERGREPKEAVGCGGKSAKEEGPAGPDSRRSLVLSCCPDHGLSSELYLNPVTAWEGYILGRPQQTEGLMSPQTSLLVFKSKSVS